MLQSSSSFQFKHGDHICVFYRSQDALMEVLTPYIAQGLLKRERCFCAQRPETLKRLSYDLRFLGVDVDREVARGALELHTVEETYQLDTGFEPSAMMEMLTTAIAAASAQGFSALRTAGEMSWAARGRTACDHIVEYEAEVAKHFPGKPAIGLCQYDVNQFAPELLSQVLENHKMSLTDAASNLMHSSLCIRQDPCNVEIVVDRFVVDPPHYYVVQRQPKSEVLGWGVAPTFDSATAQAEQLVRSLYSQPRSFGA